MPWHRKSRPQLLLKGYKGGNVWEVMKEGFKSDTMRVHRRAGPCPATRRPAKEEDGRTRWFAKKNCGILSTGLTAGGWTSTTKIPNELVYPLRSLHRFGKGSNATREQKSALGKGKRKEGGKFTTKCPKGQY